LDGSGYPSGLRGDEIIMPARILAVADVVEAMSMRRPYRPAFGIEAALAEISEGSGTKYDARVASSCLAVFKDGFTFDGS
jgi:HD-GYP domain-containing protein (c-di-GMP phosphodiesterase class II)